MVSAESQKWKKVKLGDLSVISRGSSPRPIADQRYFVGGSIPWIKIADATKSGKFLYQTKEHVNEFGASFSRLLPKGSLIVAASGTLGYTQFLGVEGCVHDGWLIVNADESKLDKNFLYYKLIEQQKYFYNNAYGAAIQNVNTGILRDLEIDLPEISVQLGISSVLSTYDDLIENNNRRIQVLENILQKIYIEWFVNFRFPGHENAKIGKVGFPENWEIKKLSTITSLITRGISPKYDDSAENIVLNQKCIRNGKLNITLARRQSKLVPSEKLLREGDVLINSTGVGTLGRVTQVWERLDNCTVDSHVTIVRPSITSEFLGRTLLGMEKYFENQGIGSTGQTELGRERIGETEILVPTESLQIQYSNLARPIHDLIIKIMKINANLTKSRDALIPQMVTGKLTIQS